MLRGDLPKGVMYDNGMHCSCQSPQALLAAAGAVVPDRRRPGSVLNGRL